MPQVIELFQSQSCNSCPPTNAALISLTKTNAGRRQQTSGLSSTSDQSKAPLLLTYHVTYWNHLSWTDTFSNRAFDERQYEYVRRMGLRSAYTPMVVVDGRVSGVGNSVQAVEKLLHQAAANAKADDEGGGEKGGEVIVDVVSREEGGEVVVSVRRSRKQERIGRAHGEEELVLKLVSYDPQEADVEVKRGENKGRTLPHLNVIKGLSSLGTMNECEEEKVFVVEGSKDAFRRAVLVQQGVGGIVIGLCEVD